MGVQSLDIIDGALVVVNPNGEAVNLLEVLLRGLSADAKSKR